MADTGNAAASGEAGNAYFVLRDPGVGFGDHSDADELRHGAMNRQVADDALTETQYFSFNVPDADIQAFCYLWMHPNLGSITGGAAAWQGIKETALTAELFDIRAYMSERAIQNGIHSFTLDNGYGVEIIEPMRRMRVFYDDPARGNSFDVLFTALSAPAMLPTRKHFEQVMRTQGQITLRGVTHKVDGFGIRDRTWAELRSEAPMSLAPLDWMTGMFGDEIAFNCVAGDRPGDDVEWKGLFDMPERGIFTGGWLWRAGEFRRLKDATKITRRDPRTLHPVRHELEMVVDDGTVLRMTGTITASCTLSVWPNLVVPICLTRWDWDGRIGWGDTQENQWTDFVHGMFQRR